MPTGSSLPTPGVSTDCQWTPIRVHVLTPDRAMSSGGLHLAVPTNWTSPCLTGPGVSTYRLPVHITMYMDGQWTQASCR